MPNMSLDTVDPDHWPPILTIVHFAQDLKLENVMLNRPGPKCWETKENWAVAANPLLTNWWYWWLVGGLIISLRICQSRDPWQISTFFSWCFLLGTAFISWISGPNRNDSASLTSMSQGWKSYSIFWGYTSHFRIAFLLVHSAKNNKWDCWIVGFPSALTTWIRIMHITPRIYIEYCLDRWINLEEQHKSQCYQLYHRFCLLDSGQVIMITKPATGQHWWLTWGYILQVHDDSWRYWEHNSASW